MTDDDDDEDEDEDDDDEGGGGRPSPNRTEHHYVLFCSVQLFGPLPALRRTAEELQNRTERREVLFCRDVTRTEPRFARFCSVDSLLCCPP